ncbi:MAG: ABC transporter permease [Actinomycetota bacterium]|nr:ABC transporter permease [Actinomycetota bacterium]
MKESPVQQEKERRSLFGRGENSTVIMMLVFFFIAIILIQLITSAASGKVVYPSFISPVNLLNIIMQVAAVGIMAMGMTVVMVGGGIDLSVGMLASFVTIFIAKSIMHWGIPLWAALILVIIVAVILEVIMGFIISRFKVEPFIITLGGMIAFRGIALIICNSQEISTQGALAALKTNLIAGAKGPSGLNLTFPIYVVVFIVIAVIIWWLMRYTKYGRRVYAVGANKNAAYLAGIDVRNVVMSTYALNGLLVGVAAIMLLARVNTAIITVGQNLEIDVIAATVVGGVALSGGKGNIWGTFIGAILLGSIANAMNILRLQSEWQFVAKGVIIIVAVTVGAIVQERQSRAQFMRQIK